MAQEPARKSAPGSGSQSGRRGSRRRGTIRTVRSFDAHAPKKKTSATEGAGKSPAKKRGTRGRPSSSSKKSSHTRGRRIPERGSMRNQPLRDSNSTPRNDPVIPPVPQNAVRIIPLGGVEEVGKNMTVIETPDDIIVCDAGFQFVSDEETPGVDYVLPNVRYLEERKDKIRGVVITHGHLDHIGGLPFILDRIGTPPVYATEVTALLIKKRQEEFAHLEKPQINTVNLGSSLTLGKTHLRIFPVTHSISDSAGVVVETPYGNIVISGDLKLDHEDGVPSAREEKVWGDIGKDKNILFIGDSTNAEKDGFSIPESRVNDTLEDLIRKTDGRMIIGTFASQFERMIHIINICEQMNKKVVAEGRSIRTNIEIAKLANRLKMRPDTIIPAEQMGDYPAERLVVLATGAQGEEFAALMRIATKKHRHISLNERDTIILSSSVIPGNEISVQRLKDNLYRHGVHLIHYRASDVHSTGHGNTGELVWIREKVKPTFFMPAYGYHSMLRCHAQANIKAGFPEKNIVIPDNGTVIDIIEGKELKVHKDKAPNSLMLVDGLSIGDLQEVVIRDRRTLAQDGMFVIIATVNAKTGELRKSPDIISRGFVYLRESQSLLGEARIIVKKSIEDSTKNMKPINFEYVRQEITDSVARFLLAKTNKRPIVIPVVLGV